MSLIEKNLKIYLPNTNSNMPGIFLNDIYNYIDYIISSNYPGNDNFHLLINTKFMKKWKDYSLDIFSKKRYQKYFFIKEDQYYKINNKNFFDKIRNRLLSKFSNKIPFDDELLYLMKLDINKFDKFTSHGSFKYKKPYDIYNSFKKNIMTILSVVMPVYNADKYLDDSILSILGQTYFDFKFYIINDGSTDLSLNIIKEYEQLDNRVILINQKNIGYTDH